MLPAPNSVRTRLLAEVRHCLLLGEPLAITTRLDNQPGSEIGEVGDRTDRRRRIPGRHGP
jgi:hypothetical protein